MMAKIVASSLLILGVLLIRAAFFKRVSPLLLYPVWLFVAVRLLMPGMLFFSPVSFMNMGLWRTGSALIAEAEDRQDMEYKKQMYREYYNTKIMQQGKAAGMAFQGENEEKTMAGISQALWEEESPAAGNDLPARDQNIKDADVKDSDAVNIEIELIQSQWAGTSIGKIRQLARMVWAAGMLIAAGVFLCRNLLFYRYLRSVRKKLPETVAGERKLPVFTVGERVTSPCLFGLLPAVYIPEKSLAANADKEQLNLIIEHELTHYRHGDHIWAFVRILCLIINWYNPLVWIAAKLSVRDGELACDAGCIRRLGEEKRCAYGEALLAVLEQSRETERVLRAATMMTSGKKFMKKRIVCIAEKRKSSILSLTIIVILMFLAVGCTYTGAVMPEEENADETVDDRTVNTNIMWENKEADEISYGGKVLVIKGEEHNGNLQGMVILLLPVVMPEANEAPSDEKNVVLLWDDLYLPDLEGRGRKLGEICQEYTDEEILAVLNRDLELTLEGIEVWNYETFMKKVDEAGGISVDVKEAEVEHLNNYQLVMTGKEALLENQVTEAGSQLLNGIQTAAYLQIRYLPVGYRGIMDRWEQVVCQLLEKEQLKIASCDEFYLDGYSQSFYVEEENYLLCLEWEKELQKFHEMLYPDKEYQPSAWVKEADEAMKRQAREVVETGRGEPNRVFLLFSQYIGHSPFMISLLSGESLPPETEDAWGTVDVYVSGNSLVVDEEIGKAVFSVHLVFTDHGILGLSKEADEGYVSVERFLYLTKEGDKWYVDGLLHNDLPAKEWWEGAQIRWEVYDFGFSDEEDVGILTTSQEAFDEFFKKAGKAAENRERMK